MCSVEAEEIRSKVIVPSERWTRKSGQNIPIYLFKERSFLVDLYRKYNLKKKLSLLKLLSSSEKVLRKDANLSLIFGLRFILNIKKITVS